MEQAEWQRGQEEMMSNSELVVLNSMHFMTSPRTSPPHGWQGGNRVNVDH